MRQAQSASCKFILTHEHLMYCVKCVLAFSYSSIQLSHSLPRGRVQDILCCPQPLGQTRIIEWVLSTSLQVYCIWCPLLGRPPETPIRGRPQHYWGLVLRLHFWACSLAVGEKAPSPFTQACEYQQGAFPACLEHGTSL